eukprot:scaffold31472_cov114-Isochrysis_galbana.AAC.2
MEKNLGQAIIQAAGWRERNKPRPKDQPSQLCYAHPGFRFLMHWHLALGLAPRIIMDLDPSRPLPRSRLPAQLLGKRRLQKYGEQLPRGPHHGAPLVHIVHPLPRCTEPKVNPHRPLVLIVWSRK